MHVLDGQNHIGLSITVQRVITHEGGGKLSVKLIQFTKTLITQPELKDENSDETKEDLESEFVATEIAEGRGAANAGRLLRAPMEKNEPGRGQGQDLGQKANKIKIDAADVSSQWPIKGVSFLEPLTPNGNHTITFQTVVILHLFPRRGMNKCIQKCSG